MELKEYTITDGDSNLGRFTMSRDGLYTLIEARVKPREGLTRLYVSGGGKSVCLGLMWPEGGVLKLRRRLSRLELQDLPESIETVSIRPPEIRPEPPAAECKAPAEAWQPMPDGSLLLITPGGKYIALPAKLRRAPPGLRLRIIDGREYLLFRY